MRPDLPPRGLAGAISRLEKPVPLVSLLLLKPVGSCDPLLLKRLSGRSMSTLLPQR